MRPWLTRTLCAVMSLCAAACIITAALGARVYRWELLADLSAMLLAWGWIIPSVARAARGWESQAQRWQALYEESDAGMVRLLRGDRGKRP